MIKPDWNKAPRWATKYGVDREGWYYWYNDIQYAFLIAQEHVYRFTDEESGALFDEITELEQRPWYELGENPPVGTECEISNCGNPYAWCKIRFMGESICVVDHKDYPEQYYHLSSVKFRLID